jgi:hypothetical protein
MAMRRCTEQLAAARIRLCGEAGSAVLEFTFLGLMLLVPVVYLVLIIAQLQGGSFAVVGAADQAAKVFASSATAADAERRAQQAATLAVADFGFDPAKMRLAIDCPTACLEPDSVVTVTVHLQVPLPLVPTMPGTGMSVATLDSSATQQIGRFR